MKGITERYNSSETTTAVKGMALYAGRGEALPLLHGEFKSSESKEKIVDFESSGTLFYATLNSAMADLRKRIKKLEEQPQVANTTIYGLAISDYILKHPVDVVLKISLEGVIALIPDLELYGEGTNEMEAIDDLGMELIDLYEDMNSLPEEELGRYPLKWKTIVNSLIEKKND